MTEQKKFDKPKKAFIVLSHRYVPRPGFPGEMQAIEDIEFVTGLKNRHYTTASTVIDAVNENIWSARNRELKYEDYVKHIIKRYPDHYRALLKLLEKPIPEELQVKTQPEQTSENGEKVVEAEVVPQEENKNGE